MKPQLTERSERKLSWLNVTPHPEKHRLLAWKWYAATRALRCQRDEIGWVRGSIRADDLRSLALRKSCAH